MDPRDAANRDLLFGLLALQNGLVDQDQLVAAFRSWTRDKVRPLAGHLVALGCLDHDQRGVVEALAGLHVRRNGGDAVKSLAGLNPGRAARAGLAGLGDPDVDATLGRVGPVVNGDETEPDGADPDRTITYVVGQRFRVIRPHASGGLGAVFVALDAELNREVALKQILDRHADDPASRKRFLAEAKITGGLEHPGVVPVYGLGRYPDGRPYYAMRLIRGESLKEAGARFHREDVPGRDPAERALGLHKLLRRFLAVCDAVAYAHSRGVLHRDLKPSNVMLGPFGETLVVDWGLAKVIGRPEGSAETPEPTLRPSPGGGGTTLPGSPMGTPGYMSPEQARGEVDGLGPASDGYSLGATLYFLLTGHAPVEEPDTDRALERVRAGDFRPPRAVKPATPPALEAVCLKAMSLSPSGRYDSPRGLTDAVEQWLAEEPVSAFRAAAAEYEALVGLHPGQSSYREGRARSLAALASVLHVVGRNAEAETAHRAAIDDYRTLVNKDPHVTSYREGLAAGFSHLGRVLMATGREAEARAAYREAFDEYERLVRAAPHALDYRTNLGNLLVSLGRNADDVQKTLGRLPAVGPGTPAPGQVVFGRYLLERKIGEGGMGSVWLARNLDLDVERALKLITSDHPFDPPTRARFQREARVMARLSHPGVVTVYAAQITETMACIEMEYVKGRSLSSMAGRGVALPPDAAVRLATQLCDVLQAAHETGVVHRDLKPGNLIVAEGRGGAVRLKVVDFGIARLLGGEDHDRAGTFVGTPQYASPEQVRGEPADARSDLYAVGVILYELLTGHRPFEGSATQLLGGILMAPPPPFAAKNPGGQVPQGVEAVVMQCLVKNPAERFASARELAEALNQAASSAPPPPVAAPLRKAAEPPARSGGLRGWLHRALGGVPEPPPGPAALPPPAAFTPRAEPPQDDEDVEAWLSTRPSEPLTPAPRRTPEPLPRVTPGPGAGAGEYGYRYQVVRPLAEGGLGKVWVVHDRELHRDVVLKELRAEEADRAEARRWFLKEAQLTAQLEHANIIPVYDLGRTLSDRPFYTMKYVRGLTLRDAIAQAHRPGPFGSSDLRRLLDAFLGVCSAVATAHGRGVIHRDLTPGNVLVDDAGVAYVSDWGLAKELGGAPGEPDRLTGSDDSPVTAVGTILGTPAYMPPEQARGDPEALDARSDVYGLGAILFEVLTGQPPFHGNSVAQTFALIAQGATPRASAVSRSVPPALDAACARAMAPKKADRYPAATDLADEVRRWLVPSTA